MWKTVDTSFKTYKIDYIFLINSYISVGYVVIK